MRAAELLEPRIYRFQRSRYWQNGHFRPHSGTAIAPGRYLSDQAAYVAANALEHPMTNIKNRAIAFGLAGALAIGLSATASAGPMPVKPFPEIR